MLEVVPYRRAMNEIDDCYRSIQQAFNETSNGNVTALHMLHGILSTERFRTPM